MRSIKESLRQRLKSFQEQQREKQQLERQIRLKEKSAFNQAYMRSRVASASQRGTLAGRKGDKHGTLGALISVGEGFAKTSDLMTADLFGSTRKWKRRKDDFSGF